MLDRQFGLSPLQRYTYNTYIHIHINNSKTKQSGIGHELMHLSNMSLIIRTDIRV